MQKVSNEYKASMKSSLRERSYMMISFGLVNQEAQANATVMTSSPKSIKQELVKAVRVPCYSYQKGTAEETLISEETEAVKGDIQTYYLGDPTYGCRATFNSSASNVSIIENGDYYVTVKFLITGKYQFEIIGHRYNIVEQYAVKTLNSRGKTITWKNPLVSDMETANHLADWLGDYYTPVLSTNTIPVEIQRLMRTTLFIRRTHIALD